MAADWSRRTSRPRRAREGSRMVTLPWRSTDAAYPRRPASCQGSYVAELLRPGGSGGMPQAISKGVETPADAFQFSPIEDSGTPPRPAVL
jgi:hypothetical protein